MSNLDKTTKIIKATGTATDMVLVDAWARGLCRSLYGDDWEAHYRRIPARLVMKAWVGLTPGEA